MGDTALLAHTITELQNQPAIWHSTASRLQLTVHLKKPVPAIAGHLTSVDLFGGEGGWVGEGGGGGGGRGEAENGIS